MMSDNLRGFFGAAAWLLIVIGVIIAVGHGLRMFGFFSPPIVSVNQGAVFQGLSVIGAIFAPIVQGGMLLSLLSIDERIQNRGQ
ncbi:MULTISPECIES: hypothetical protein [unclassified Brevundimonas]|uniref:hypothetical protein n=1 Tax=unclassified Brevundimonas TaxID=2622653 RepID=UPI0025BCF032|nr:MULTISPECIES: hypothetical protein [unclassified Brevundimonas]